MYEYIPAFHVSFFHRGQWGIYFGYSLIYLLQFAEDVARFYDIYAAVEESYKDGKPPAMLGPDYSCTRILKNEDFCKMSHGEIQKIMRTHHIIVTGVPHPQMDFSEAAFNSLNPGESVNRIVTVHGE